MTQPETNRQSAVNVIVVDDDPLVRRALSTMLTESGYQVRTFADGESAQEAIQRGPVDVVVLDVMMPGLSGLDVCRRLKQSEAGKRVPVVLLTALGSAEDVLTGLDAGADEFLTKPIEPEVLEARMRAILRFKRAQERAGEAPKLPTLPELLTARVRELADQSGLSPREREVLDLLLLGRTMDEIGVALSISPRTAKFHQANVLNKLGAESRLELLRLML
jgi:DNA-binding response OmpR family regulator